MRTALPCTSNGKEKRERRALRKKRSKRREEHNAAIPLLDEQEDLYAREIFTSSSSLHHGREAMTEEISAKGELMNALPLHRIVIRNKFSSER